MVLLVCGQVLKLMSYFECVAANNNNEYSKHAINLLSRRNFSKNHKMVIALLRCLRSLFRAFSWLNFLFFFFRRERKREWVPFKRNLLCLDWSFFVEWDEKTVSRTKCTVWKIFSWKLYLVKISWISKIFKVLFFYTTYDFA